MTTLNNKKRIEIELPIKPIPKQEIKVRFGRKKGYYSARYNNYKKSLFTLIKSQIDKITLSDDEVLSLDVRFYNYKIIVIIDVIKNKLNLYNPDKPDLDNLLKPLLDELKIAIGVDDSRIVKLSAIKYQIGRR
jgi:Holliday junction resolvase RusA-like endonuclease